MALEVGADGPAVGPEGEGVGLVVGVEEGFAVCAVGGVGLRDGGLEGEPVAAAGDAAGFVVRAGVGCGGQL